MQQPHSLRRRRFARFSVEVAQAHPESRQAQKRQNAGVREEADEIPRPARPVHTIRRRLKVRHLGARRTAEGLRGRHRDSADGQAGADTLIWRSGDGNDTLIGGDGPVDPHGRPVDDVLALYGETPDGDAFHIGLDTVDASRVKVDHSPVVKGITVDSSTADGVERIELRTGEGDDLIEIADLTGTDVTSLYAELNGGSDTLSAADATTPMTVYAGDGDDSVTTGSASDELHGGAGDDTLDGGPGNDLLYGDDGNDTYVLGAGSGADAVNDSIGDADRLDFSGSSQGVTVDLATDLPQVFCVAGDSIRLVRGIESVVGSAHDDVLLGDGGPNVLIGNGGDDTLTGRGGNDTLLGGFAELLNDGTVELTQGDDGNDTLNADAGDDALIGGGGDDILNGGDGHDAIIGGFAAVLPANTFQALDQRGVHDGDDILSGGAGNDTLFGGSGDDQIDAGTGEDYADGGTGDDTVQNGLDSLDVPGGLLVGWTGEDTITGGDASDRVFGDEGNDALDAGLGHNRIDAGPGDDHIVRDPLADTVVEGSGADVVVGRS